MLNLDAGHFTAVFGERKHVGVELEGHAFAKGERRHAGDQCIAHCQSGTAMMLQAVATVAQQQLATMRQ